MKKFTYLLVLILSFGILNAQENTDNDTAVPNKSFKHELKLNMLELIVMPAIGITYEHYLNPYSSAGVYAFANFGIDEELRHEKAELAPFYRIYFQRQKNASNQGLFTEIFGGINYGETEFYDYDRSYYNSGKLLVQEYVGVAVGVTLGYKFVNYNNYTFDLFGGAGRYLNDQEVKAYPRIGLSIGKRF